MERGSWHESGRRKIVATYSRGVEVIYDEWSEAGTLLAHREVDPHSSLGTYAGGDSGADA